MRGYIPKVRYLKDYKTALSEAAKADMPLFFYENEHATTLKMALNEKEYKTVSILTGPEGGFSETEVEQAVTAGLKVCTLGKRILRCETAPLCALSAIMYDSGEF
jgi:16S rRNA (uracil1498-N3)-methyltransferase